MKLLALCPTFGRPKHLIENTLACFKQQTYPLNYRRLFIFDDGGTLGNQSGPDWTIRTHDRRCESLPAKYRWMLQHAVITYGLMEMDFDAIVVWDDDDVYLPRHLEASAAVLRDHAWSYPSRVWSDYDGLHQEPTDGRFHGSLAVRMDTLKEIGGWPQTDRADFDQQFIERLKDHSEPGDPLDFHPEPTYVFRWSSTGSHHCQAEMTSPENTTWYQETAEARCCESTPICGVQPKFDAAAEILLVETGDAVISGLRQPCLPSDNLQPITNTTIKGLAHDEYNLNGSIAEHQGELFMAYRAGWERSRIHFAGLKNEQRSTSVGLILSPSFDTQLDLTGNESDSFEDPRLIVHNDTFLIGYTRAWYGADGLHTSECLAGIGVETQGQVHYPKAQQVEKNWQYFSYSPPCQGGAGGGRKADLYAVYSLSPTKILRILPDGDSWLAYDDYHTQWESPWPGELLRGGAPPVRYNDHLYCFFHSVCDQMGTRAYSMAVAKLRGEPPFDVVAITPRAIMGPPAEQWKQHPRVVYPRGAVLKEDPAGDRWLISYGWQDHQVRVAEFRAQDVEARLVDVQSKVSHKATKTPRPSVVDRSAIKCNVDAIFDTAETEIQVPDENHARAIKNESIKRDVYRLRELAESDFRPKVIWDLGAAYGTVTWLLAKLWPAAEVYAFEPDPGRFEWLKTNCDLLDVSCLQVAMVGRDDLEESIVATDPVHRQSQSEYLTVIKDSSVVVPGDAAQSPEIDLLKIDIEGAEVGVLRDLHRWGLLQRIEHIRGEWHFAEGRAAVEKYLGETHDLEILGDVGWNQFYARKKS